ncbi:MAG TPA: hypothetical protein VN041_09700 [Microbacterium sp.]|nr:hypothetical protein [Microbacterium sp.]
MTLRLRYDGIEGSPREPHKRWYKSPGRDKWSSVDVDGMGIVSVTEEAIHHLLTEAGYTETDPPKWAVMTGTDRPDGSRNDG